MVVPGDDRVTLAGGAQPTPAFADDPPRLASLLSLAVAALDAGRRARGGPVPAGAPGQPHAALRALAGDTLPQHGSGEEAALHALTQLLAEGHADPTEPACAAHLHCPPLAVAVAADAAVSALNPSLDSWDQGPSSAAAEELLLRWLAELAGFDVARAGGTLTTGASASTLTALLLARDGFASGRPLRIACSEHAHFSVQRAAQILGLGEQAVDVVPCDEQGRLAPEALAALAEADRRPRDAAGVRRPGREAAGARVQPARVVVATAGTTDLGAIDPLPAIADLAEQHRWWLHVDAAYGGGALWSRVLRPLLRGLDRATSVALDAHKLGWQPAACGVLLLADRSAMAPLAREVAYLNAADDDAAGYEDRLGRSLRTTRRPDAFKLLVTIHALGVGGLGLLVDRCHELARCVYDTAAAEPSLEVFGPPTLTTVLLRPRLDDPVARDERCATIRRRLLASGTAVVGRTELPGDGPGRRWLKLTLLHPGATVADAQQLISEIARSNR
ncbi:MAG: pyridoxal-dependent decarboxylase [Patulibacter sp.]